MTVKALDHDYYVANLTPSVIVNCEIPGVEDVKDSFSSGKPFVATKGCIFSPSCIRGNFELKRLVLYAMVIQYSSVNRCRPTWIAYKQSLVTYRV